jgi:hypothetical protein
LIENSTISGNTASGTTLTDMGAIYAVRPMIIRFCTITGNTTPANRRGAVGSFGGGFTITVYSSIIAGNTNGDIGYNNSPSPFISLGYNLIGTGNNSSLASFNQAGDQTGVLNPMLGALANNGGSTQTQLPLAGSPAIDAGNPAAVAGVGGVPLYDQRGLPHTRGWDGDGAGGARMDIGAVEVQTQPLPRAVFGDYNADGVVDAGDFVLARKTAGATVAPYADADGSGNGVVGVEDEGVWRAHYGEVVPIVAGTEAELAESSAQNVAQLADQFRIADFGLRINAEHSSHRASAAAVVVFASVASDNALIDYLASRGSNGELAFDESSGSPADACDRGARDALDMVFGGVGGAV